MFVARDRGVLAIALAALLLRLIVALVLWERPLHDDEFAYDAVARNLVAGKGFSTAGPIGLVNPGHDAPSSLWGCLQPLWLAAIYACCGIRAGPVYLANAVLGLAPILSAAALGNSLGGVRTARLAAGFVAINPYLVKLSASLLSETLYLALLWPALAVVRHWRERPGLRAAALAGLLLALASLVRAPAFYLALWLAVWLAIERGRGAGRRARLFAELGVFALALVLGIAPWVARNRRVHSPAVFLDTKAGWNLYSYLHPEFVPAALNQPPVPPEVLDPALSESQRNQLLLEHAGGFFRSDPVHVLRMIPAKLWLLWSPFPGARTDPGSAPLKLGFVLPLELLALAGIARLGLGSPLARQLLVLIAFHLVLHSVMTGGPRFRVPLDPGLSLLAAAALPRSFTRTRAGGGPPG